MNAGVVTCPWHSWTFDLCKGCSLDPVGHSVQTHETLIEEGPILYPTAKTAAVEAAARFRSVSRTQTSCVQ